MQAAPALGAVCSLSVGNGVAMHDQVDILLKIFEIAAIVGACAVFMFGLGRHITKFEKSQEIMTLTFEASQKRYDDSQKIMSTDIVDLKADVKKMSEVMTAVALQRQSIDAINTRMNMQDQQMTDLRKGKGWITDDEARRTIDGEYSGRR